MADLIFVVASISIATLLRFDFTIEEAIKYLPLLLMVAIPIRLITFRWFRTYAVIVRYAGASDIIQVFLAVSAGSLFLAGIAIVLRPYGISLPLSVLVIDYFLLVTFMAGFRMMMPILFYFLTKNQASQTQIILIGAGQLGAITRNVIRQDRESNYNIVAIIDDNKDVNNKFLDGIPVYAPSYLPTLVGDWKIEKAIFAIQRISNKRKNELVELCLEHNIQVLQVPFKSSWMSEDFKVDQLQEIEIEDLLNRAAIRLSSDQLSSQ